MRCTCRGRAGLSAVLDKCQGRGAVGANDPDVFCPPPGDVPGSHFCDSIARAEIMNYLSQTYGSAFVDDLVKHLPQPDDGQEHTTRCSSSDTAQDGHRKPTTATI